MINKSKDEKGKGEKNLEFIELNSLTKKNQSQKITLYLVIQLLIKCFLYIFFKIFYFLKINPKRNYGIDLARIIASILVFLNHIQDENLSKRIPAYKKLLELNLIYLQNDNIYGLISGFILVKKLNIRRFIYLFSEVLYYAYYWDYQPKKLYNIPLIIRKEMKYNNIFDNIKEFWYFRTYLPIFFVLPLIHPEKSNIDFFRYLIIFCVLFLFFSFFPIYLNKDIYSMKTGAIYFFIFLLAFLGRCLGYMELHKKICFIIWGTIYIWILYLGYIAKYGNEKNKYT